MLFLGLGLVFYGFKSPSGKILPTEIPSQTHSPLPNISVGGESSATNSATLGLQGERVKVTKVVDGDTLQIDTGQTVRFIGIDTPETVDPRRPVGCFGKEASNKTKELLTGKEIVLQKDVSETDKYDRILRYIYLPLEDGNYLFINDYLVREGYAKAYTYPPDVKFDQQFKLAEKQARENNRGLWASCPIPTKK
jgi:endonuclease YncB( thermonuclease family)